MHHAQAMADTRADGWANVITGLGIGMRDKRLGGTVQRPCKLEPQVLEDLFVGDSLFKRVCMLPPREMTRQWVTLSADSEEQAKKHKQRQQELGIQHAVFKAMVWGRLYGGGVIIIGADDGAMTRMDEPLNEENIRTLSWVTVLERRQLEIVGRYNDELGPKFGEPRVYRLNGASGIVDGGTTLVNANGRPFRFDRTIHESRVIRFDGVLTPLIRTQENNGWCDSIAVSLLEVIRDTWGGFNGVSALLADFAQAVFKMKGLASMMGGGQESVVLARLKQVDLVRSLMRAVVIDESESFERTPTPMTGLPEALDKLQQIICAVTGMPATKLWGQSAKGLNATGDNDVRNWYDDMKSDQDTDLRPKLERIFKLMWLAKDGPSGGQEPKNWEFTFNPLWQPTSKERAEVRKANAEADQIDINAGVLHPEEVRQSRYGSGQYNDQITLDPDFDDPESRPSSIVQQAEAGAANDPNAGDQGPAGAA